MSTRVDKLRGLLPQKGVDALLISMPENRRYMSGFTGSAGYLFISGEQAVLGTDFRYTEQAAGQAPDFQIVRISGDWSWLGEKIKETGASRLGFESHHMTVQSYQALSDALAKQLEGSKPALVATSGIAEQLRVFKDAEELAALQKAVDVADQAMESVCAIITEGMTEKEVAWRLEVAMRELGAEGPSFDTIVAAGPNGAMPHHHPSDRPIQTGEPIVIDMGAKVDGYCSDITRTICVGEPDEMFRRVYDIVLGSQLTAINTVKPGMTGGDCDELSRTVIAEAGYGDNFGHSLGHGYGLAVHEYPRVGPNADNILEEGMVFTVEPGIYLTGWGGVRIEDDVVLEASGARVLSGSKK
jgi:Xaa-Pro aminopeptidase